MLPGYALWDVVEELVWSQLLSIGHLDHILAAGWFLMKLLSSSLTQSLDELAKLTQASKLTTYLLGPVSTKVPNDRWIYS